jgi:hypothetical protein
VKPDMQGGAAQGMTSTWRQQRHSHTRAVTKPTCAAVTPNSKAKS